MKISVKFRNKQFAAGFKNFQVQIEIIFSNYWSLYFQGIVTNQSGRNTGFNVDIVKQHVGAVAGQGGRRFYSNRCSSTIVDHYRRALFDSVIALEPVSGGVAIFQSPV